MAGVFDKVKLFGEAFYEVTKRNAVDLLNLGRQVIQEKTGLNPGLQDEVVVEVVGQPGVTKQQLYFTALAAANGIVRRFGSLFNPLTPNYGQLMIEYDAAGHWVRASISYRTSMAATNVRFVPDDQIFSRLAVYRGPQCAVVGGTFDFVTEVPGEIITIPGIPLSAASPGAPVLPLEGQPILTACPTTVTPNPRAIVQDPAPTYPIGGPNIPAPGPPIVSPNPKPPGDNRSRGAVLVPSFGPGSVGGGTPVPGPPSETSGSDNIKCCDKLRALVPLVFAALTASATNSKTTYPLPTQGPTGV